MENQAVTLTDKNYYEVSKTKKIIVKPQKSEEEVPQYVRRFVVRMTKAKQQVNWNCHLLLLFCDPLIMYNIV